LNDLFRSGSLPRQPLDGAYDGDFLTTTVGWWADAAIRAVTSHYMPWKGKTFDKATNTGRNLFTGQSKPLIKPFDPGARLTSSGLVSAYPFETWTGPGAFDADRQVLKIDYDIRGNRSGLIRRVLDELVEVEPGYFLGKAHLRMHDHWRTVAFFALRPAQGA
jgi:hypothetical protein